MTDKAGRTLATTLVAALLALAIALTVKTQPARADQLSIANMTAAHVIASQSITASGSFTQGQAGSNTRPFTALEKTTNQTVQVQGTGTSPNYKVELLVCIDGTNYVKPEVGGDLGTFTDSSRHVIPLSGPACSGHELKFTELGGNGLTADAWELSQ